MQNAPIFSTTPKEKNKPGVHKRRTGLMKALIGSPHLVMVGKKLAQFSTRELSRHPEAKMRAICINCCKWWATAEELVDAHPSVELMDKRDEQHVFALWSDDPINPEEPIKDAAGKVVPQKVDPLKVLGLLSDEWPSVAR